MQLMLRNLFSDLIRLLYRRRKEVIGYADTVQGKGAQFHPEEGMILVDGVQSQSFEFQRLDSPTEKQKWSLVDKRNALRGQKILANVPDGLLDTIANSGEIVEYKAGDALANQDEHGDKVFFVIHGKIGVYVNERLVDYGEADDCEGEMLALNVLRRRSSTLLAEEDSTILVADIKTLARLFEDGRINSQLLYNEALILADRLRNRSKFHTRPNGVPKVFIGSSTEAYPIAKRLRKLIERTKKAVVIDWTDGVFLPSRSSMENLERIADDCDFAIMVLSGDDRTSYRGKSVVEPRDNCIFELGLFMGRLGKTRAYFLVDDAKLPSDLHGETYLKYRNNKNVHLSRVVKKLVEEFDSQGGR